MRLRLLPSVAVFTPNPFDATYFLPTAAKSKQKMPLQDKTLHPTITPI
jgi:hydroxymethylpyrimidine/phosphomethylpyrimidine kinase